MVAGARAAEWNASGVARKPSEGEICGVAVQAKMFRILAVVIAASPWDFGLALVVSLACCLYVGLCQAC